MGNYKLSSLSGTYAFMTSGTVITNTSTGPVESSLVRVGSFVADGTGHITGGVEDVNAQGTVNTAIAINNTSTYTINSDGRGTLTLDVTANGAPATINFAIVLTSGKSGSTPASDGLMIDETSTTNQASTGSGNFILQDTAALGISTISGPYVFDFSGLDGNQPANPESLVGQFSATNAGTITGGFEDANDGGALSSGSMAPGTLTADQANMATSGRGTAVIEGQTYAFYIVDANRVRFISINSVGLGPMLTGDAVLQRNIPTSVNGGFAFLVAGSDANGNGLIRVGRFTAAGTTLSKMLMDVNDNANETPVNNLSNGTISTYDPATGRGTLSFQQGAPTTLSFVFYLSSPSAGVIQEVSAPAGSANAVAVDDGSIALQSGNPFTSSNISGTYAMNWSGTVTANNTTAEEDLLSQVTATNLSLSGTSDIYQFTNTVLAPATLGTGGTINFNGGDGAGDDGKRVSMTVNLSNTSPIHMVVYIVSPQLAFFANSDNSDGPRVVAGILESQQ
jgi:hypothetical protein